jgi:hypothetical protein
MLANRNSVQRRKVKSGLDEMLNPWSIVKGYAQEKDLGMPVTMGDPQFLTRECPSHRHGMRGTAYDTRRYQATYLPS